MSPHLSNEISLADGNYLDPRFQLFVDKISQTTPSPPCSLCSCGSWTCTACFDGCWTKDPTGPIDGDELEELVRSFRWLQLTQSSFSRKRSQSGSCLRGSDDHLLTSPPQDPVVDGSPVGGSPLSQRPTGEQVEACDPVLKRRVVGTEILERSEQQQVVVSRASQPLQCRRFWMQGNANRMGSARAKLH